MLGADVFVNKLCLNGRKAVGVGENLQDHIVAPLRYSCDKPVSINNNLGLLGRARIGLEWLLFRSGLGASNFFEVGAFFDSGSGAPFINMQHEFLGFLADFQDGVYSHRSGVRENGNVIYRGYAVPECVFIDYDVLRAAPRHLNRSGVGDILCFHAGVLDWQYARDNGKIEAKWPYDEDLDQQSLSKVDAIIKSIDGIRNMTDAGMRSHVNSLPLWHSLAHDAAITPVFIADLKLRLDRAYGQRA